jgi:tetratricopeptide (TPR) repeat protein
MRAIRTFTVGLLGVGLVWSGESARDLGMKAFSEGRYNIALEQLKTASQDPSDKTARVFLSLTYGALGDCKIALPGLANYSEIADTQLSKMAGLAAVNCFATTNDSGRVFSSLQDLQHRFPEDADVLYVAAKQYMKAFNETTMAMFQRTPASYRVHELSAEVFEVENRYSDAVGEYNKAIEENAHAPELHYQLGRAILLSSHSAEALAQAKQAFLRELEVSPEDAVCQFQLGQIATAEGNQPEAQSRFEKAVALTPDFVDALVALGKIESQQKQYAKAISLLQRAIEKEPSNERAHYALLTAYRNAGQMDKAQEEKAALDRLQKPKEGEFSDFLKRLGEKPAAQ